MNRLKGYHQDLELNTIIYWLPMKVVKYRINMIEFHCVLSLAAIFCIRCNFDSWYLGNPYNILLQ